MRLFITGATGQIGRRLVLDRLERGDQVVLLSRDARKTSAMFAADANRAITVVPGNPATPGIWQKSVEGCEAVIHLAAAGVADKRWSAAYKKAIVSSRIDSTHQVVSAIEQCHPDRRPRVLINGSATGFYGDTGDKAADETARAGHDFLARLCTAWEAQALRAESLGVRVVLLRTGVVLDDRGGALVKMMKPFEWYIGGPMGSGRQYMPWIHWRDELGLIDLALTRSDLRGPLNCVSPEQITNRTLARALGNTLGKPSGLPVPKFMLRIAMGEMADVLTTSQRVAPAKALKCGYRFLFPGIELALESLIGGEMMDDHALAPAETSNAPAPSATPAFVTSSASPGPSASPAPICATTAPAARPLPTPMPSNAMPAMPIRLLAMSVDQTLLRSDGSIAQGVIQACRNAERNGCAIVLATARPPRGLKSILQALDITGPTINYNGAVIWNPLDNRAQYHEPLPPELARAIVDDARRIEPNVLVALDVLDRWHVDPHDPRIDTRFAAQASGLFEPDDIGRMNDHLASPVTKLNLMGEPAQLQPVLGLLREKYWRTRQAALVLTDPHVIQITHPLVDKGIALQRIANRMNLNRDEVMAIGDGANDLGMLEWAGFSVAMGNAIITAKELADAVVPTNDDLGVARAIQRYVLARR